MRSIFHLIFLLSLFSVSFAVQKATPARPGRVRQVATVVSGPTTDNVQCCTCPELSQAGTFAPLGIIVQSDSQTVSPEEVARLEAIAEEKCQGVQTTQVCPVCPNNEQLREMNNAEEQVTEQQSFDIEQPRDQEAPLQPPQQQRRVVINVVAGTCSRTEDARVLDSLTTRRDSRFEDRTALSEADIKSSKRAAVCICVTFVFATVVFPVIVITEAFTQFLRKNVK